MMPYSGMNRSTIAGAAQQRAAKAAGMKHARVILTLLFCLKGMCLSLRSAFGTESQLGVLVGACRLILSRGCVFLLTGSSQGDKPVPSRDTPPDGGAWTVVARAGG